MYHTTETAQLAHMVLPAAGWGEKDGTFINSERRIGVVRPVRKAPGQALSDFRIFRLIADAWGCGDMFARWNSPEAVFRMLQECTRGQPCDITGIEGYEMLEERSGVQWPWTVADEDALSRVSKERRLFADGRYYHPDGRAKFLFEAPQPLSEPPNDHFPLILLTGRGSASQWHTETRTSKSSVLRKLYPSVAYVEINPRDAADRKIVPEMRVTVSSQRGRMRAKAILTHNVQPGQVFVSMHDAATNRLTDAVFDPYSKQPSYKACAVQVLPAG